MQLDSLSDVLKQQLDDLLSAEQQLVEALPKMAGAATNRELREAFEHHLEETRGHVSRLGDVFGQAGFTPSAEQCAAMAGLISEGEKVVSAQGDPNAKDVALIAAAQRVEHYEIAAYGTARTIADDLGLDAAKSLLDETLDEESNADKRLTKIATGGMFGSGINEQAVRQ
jgi:ferritin-like metal-binding protein YciE